MILKLLVFHLVVVRDVGSSLGQAYLR